MVCAAVCIPKSELRAIIREEVSRTGLTALSQELNFIKRQIAALSVDFNALKVVVLQLTPPIDGRGGSQGDTPTLNEFYRALYAVENRIKHTFKNDLIAFSKSLRSYLSSEFEKLGRSGTGGSLQNINNILNNFQASIRAEINNSKREIIHVFKNDLIAFGKSIRADIRSYLRDLEKNITHVVKNEFRYFGVSIRADIRRYLEDNKNQIVSSLGIRIERFLSSLQAAIRNQIETLRLSLVALVEKKATAITAKIDRLISIVSGRTGGDSSGQGENSNFNNITSLIGGLLNRLTTAINSAFSNAFSNITGFLNNIRDTIQASIVGAVSSISNILSRVFTKIEGINQAINDKFRFIGGLIGNISNFLSRIPWKSILDILGDILGKIKLFEVEFSLIKDLNIELKAPLLEIKNNINNFITIKDLIKIHLEKLINIETKLKDLVNIKINSDNIKTTVNEINLRIGDITNNINIVKELELEIRNTVNLSYTLINSIKVAIQDIKSITNNIITKVDANLNISNSLSVQITNQHSTTLSLLQSISAEISVVENLINNIEISLNQNVTQNINTVITSINKIAVQLKNSLTAILQRFVEINQTIETQVNNINVHIDTKLTKVVNAITNYINVSISRAVDVSVRIETKVTQIFEHLVLVLKAIKEINVEIRKAQVNIIADVKNTIDVKLNLSYQKIVELINNFTINITNSISKIAEYYFNLEAKIQNLININNELKAQLILSIQQEIKRVINLVVDLSVEIERKFLIIINLIRENRKSDCTEKLEILKRIIVNLEIAINNIREVIVDIQQDINININKVENKINNVEKNIIATINNYGTISNDTYNLIRAIQMNINATSNKVAVLNQKVEQLRLEHQRGYVNLYNTAQQGFSTLATRVDNVGDIALDGLYTARAINASFNNGMTNLGNRLQSINYNITTITGQLEPIRRIIPIIENTFALINPLPSILRTVVGKLDDILEILDRIGSIETVVNLILDIINRGGGGEGSHEPILKKVYAVSEVFSERSRHDEEKVFYDMTSFKMFNIDVSTPENLAITLSEIINCIQHLIVNQCKQLNYLQKIYHIQGGKERFTNEAEQSWINPYVRDPLGYHPRVYALAGFLQFHGLLGPVESTDPDIRTKISDVLTKIYSLRDHTPDLMAFKTYILDEVAKFFERRGHPPVDMVISPKGRIVYLDKTEKFSRLDVPSLNNILTPESNMKHWQRRGLDRGKDEDGNYLEPIASIANWPDFVEAYFAYTNWRNGNLDFPLYLIEDLSLDEEEVKKKLRKPEEWTLDKLTEEEEEELKIMLNTHLEREMWGIKNLIEILGLTPYKLVIEKNHPLLTEYDIDVKTHKNIFRLESFNIEREKTLYKYKLVKREAKEDKIIKIANLAEATKEILTSLLELHTGQKLIKELSIRELLESASIRNTCINTWSNIEAILAYLGFPYTEKKDSYWLSFSPPKSEEGDDETHQEVIEMLEPKEIFFKRTIYDDKPHSTLYAYLKSIAHSAAIIKAYLWEEVVPTRMPDEEWLKQKPPEITPEEWLKRKPSKKEYTKMKLKEKLEAGMDLVDKIFDVYKTVTNKETGETKFIEFLKHVVSQWEALQDIRGKKKRSSEEKPKIVYYDNKNERKEL